VATETDAARDRVLAARAALGDELETLEASARAAADVPAKIRRSPGKAAALAGGTAFLVLGGPRRVFRAGRRAVTGAPEPLPEAMLPKEVEKTLRYLGDDGAKVRGALERDFAAYFLLMMISGHFSTAWDVFEMGWFVRTGRMSPASRFVYAPGGRLGRTFRNRGNNSLPDRPA
jgi:hypothetical protein